MSQHSSHFYQFGEFLIDTKEQQLFRGNKIVPLTPKVFDTLLFFVENSERMLTKNELMERVWAGSFVEEANLTQNVSTLRKALGENPHEHRFIATVPGRGYRFVAPVRELPDEETNVVFQEKTRAPIKIEKTAAVRHRFSKIYFVSQIALIAALCTAFGSFYLFRGDAKSAPQTIDSLAILPFTNADGNTETEYFVDGLTESLINRFSQLSGVRVVSRSTAFRYKNQSIAPAEIGQKLDVKAILTGNVLQQGERVKIQIELIDTERDAQLWGETFDVKSSEILSAQDAIAREVAETMNLRLHGDEKLQIAKNYTDDAEAFRHYLKGRYFWNKRTKENLEKAVAEFNAAIERDPAYALAYAGLADAYLTIGGQNFQPPAEALPKARAAAEKALEIDQSLAEAHTSLAMIKLLFDWDFAGAETNFRRAVRLKPNYATAHQWYGHCLMVQGRFDESIEEMKSAARLDPLSLIINSALGYSYWHARRYDEAIVQLNKTLEIDPNFLPAISYLGMAYEQTGQYREALAAFQRQNELMGDEKAMLVMLGRVHALSGDKQKTAEVLAKIRSNEKSIPAIYHALIYAALSDKEKAFPFLEKAFEESSSWMPHLKTDPRFDNLRSDSRFQVLLGKIGF
jgi:TolB-like protein/DNA-binding winged helix-turn-helix (wHTH) protein/Tfp pilus assembly protein PilF